MLVLIGILGIILAIAVPFTLGQLARLRIEGFATRLTSLVHSTRGRAIRDNKEHSIQWEDTDTDGIDDAISGVSGISSGTADSVFLRLEEQGLTPYTDASCLDVDNDGFADHTSDPLTYGGTGTTDDLVAFCFEDPSGNVMQVSVDTPSGPPKIRKKVPGIGFTTQTWEWQWY